MHDMLWTHRTHFYLKNTSYHRFLCNFLHGSLTKNSGLPNIKYIQKLDNSNFSLSALKCRILCFPDSEQLELSPVSVIRTYIAEKKQEQQISTQSWKPRNKQELWAIVAVSVFLRSFCTEWIISADNYLRLHALKCEPQINPHSVNYESERSEL